jgi:hypothetical protein
LCELILFLVKVVLDWRCQICAAYCNSPKLIDLRGTPFVISDTFKLSGYFPAGGAPAKN